MKKAAVPSAITALVLAGSVWFAAAQSRRQVANGPAMPTKADAGVEIYKGHCAACHGWDGKGHGPAAEALKAPPTDLTLLKRKNRGDFPTATVELAIDGAAPITAHGNHDLPVWGRVFQPTQQGNEALARLRVANVVKYLESIQQ
jgi:hypothetical protein